MLLDPFSEIHQVLREFPRYNRFVHAPYGLSVTLLESHLMVELSGGEGDIRASELATRLMVDKYVISRAISSLVEMELLTSRPDPTDGRERRLGVSQKGRRWLTGFDREANTRLETFDEIASFSPQDRKILTAALEGLADALEIPCSPLRDNEHRLRPAIRRLTRGFGLLGSRVFDTELSTLRWQALLEIVEAPRGIALSHLKESLLVPESTASDTVSWLSRKKLVTRDKGVEDERMTLIESTQAGRTLVREVTARRARLYRLKIPEGTAVEEWARVLSLWVAAAAVAHVLRTPGYELRVLDDETQLHQARRIALDALKETYPIPEVLFSPQHQCIGVFAGREMRGAIEFRTDKGFATLVNAVCLDPADHEVLRAAVWSTVRGKRLNLYPHLGLFEFDADDSREQSILSRSIRALLGDTP